MDQPCCWRVVDGKAVRTPLKLGLRDGQAVEVLKMQTRAGAWDAVNWAYGLKREYRLRYLDRVPLWTRYTEVVERVRRVVEARGMTGAGTWRWMRRGWGGRWWSFCGGRGWRAGSRQ